MSSAFTLKVWTGLSLAAAALCCVPAIAGPVDPTQSFASGGEGGEGGGERGGATIYRLESKDPQQFRYDANAQVEGYVTLVHASYSAAARDARALQKAIEAFLAAPSRETLADARRTWIAARPAYLRTEAFRFYDGPIEAVEGRINAWPVNEAGIDYVSGDAKAGLVNDRSKPVTLAAINALDQAKDESDVTTGWHAIEFLLWGQDLSATGPGDRPYTDYLPGKGNNDRRRAYLALVTKQLADDIVDLAQAWEPSAKSGAAAKLRTMDQRDALGRALNGMAILAGFELMSERLAVALDSGDQEDEHSCFSDTTHQDFVHNLQGIKAVWTGKGPSKSVAGLDVLAGARDPALRASIDALFANTEARIAALGDPWDRVLAAPKDSPERKNAEAAVQALKALGDGLRRAGQTLGVLVQIPAAGG